jgi:hypothetical protein
LFYSLRSGLIAVVRDAGWGARGTFAKESNKLLGEVGLSEIAGKAHHGKVMQNSLVAIFTKSARNRPDPARACLSCVSSASIVRAGSQLRNLHIV